MKVSEILTEVHPSRRMRDVGDRPRKHEERHCLRKNRYPTVKDARLALLQLWKKGRPERSFYPCEYCGQFHITSNKPTGFTRT